jgi:hypothetical protein
VSSVQDFIYQSRGGQREVLHYLHELLTREYDLTDKIRYRIPFYDGASWICYCNPTGEGMVELAFVRGNELSNEQGLLIGGGRKQVLGVEFATTDDIPHEMLREVIQEAILLDQSVPYSPKRSKRSDR